MFFLASRESSIPARLAKLLKRYVARLSCADIADNAHHWWQELQGRHNIRRGLTTLLLFIKLSIETIYELFCLFTLLSTSKDKVRIVRFGGMLSTAPQLLS